MVSGFKIITSCHPCTCACVLCTGIDDNACCGTHVSNLADIQAIKLLHTEKKRGSTLVYYLAGSRVFRYMDQAVGIEQKLTRLLRHVFQQWSLNPVLLKYSMYRNVVWVKGCTLVLGMWNRLGLGFRGGFSNTQFYM